MASEDELLLPNLRHVRLAMIIASGTSLRKAAHRLSVTQPAATLSISALEQQYGVQLFERRTNGLSQTIFGAAFARRAARCTFYLSRALAKVASSPDPSVELIEKQMNLLTISQLRALAALDEHHGLRSAADSLRRSVPSIHRSLGQLEASLDVDLIHREKHGASLNFLGHEIAVLFSLALRELRLSHSDIKALNGQLEGYVTIGCVRVTASTLLPIAIKDCVRSLPGARFSVTQDQYENMLEALRAGRLDYFCGTARKTIPKELTSEKLCSSTLCVICGPHHPLAKLRNISVETLATFPWIGDEARTDARIRFDQLFESAGIAPPPISVKSQQFAFVRSLLLQTDFLAHATRSSVGEDQALSDLCILDRAIPDQNRDIWLLSRSDWEPSAVHQEFVKSLRRAAHNE